MADSGLGAKVDKKTVSYVVAGTFCVYALVYKIPIPCFGRQKEGFWYRCVMDTGEGTTSCDAYKQAENRVKSPGRIMDQAGVYGEFVGLYEDRHSGYDFRFHCDP